jgi:hypothetical protein
MENEFRLKVNTEKLESENRWYIVRKLVTKTCWFFPDKVEWIPLTCSEVGYPKYGVHLPEDISYFFDDYCASVACMKLK